VINVVGRSIAVKNDACYGYHCTQMLDVIDMGVEVASVYLWYIVVKFLILVHAALSVIHDW